MKRLSSTFAFAALFFIGASTFSFTNSVAESRRPAGVGSQAATENFMISQGMRPEMAKRFAALSPDFFMKVLKIASNRSPDLYAELGGTYKVVHVYRGVSLRNASDFDPNYGLFILQDGQMAGAIDVTTDPEVAKNYAKSRPDQKAFIVDYELPAVLLDRGKFDGAYRIMSSELVEIGIRDIRLFQVGFKEIH